MAQCNCLGEMALRNSWNWVVTTSEVFSLDFQKLPRIMNTNALLSRLHLENLHSWTPAPQIARRAAHLFLEKTSGEAQQNVS